MFASKDLFFSKPSGYQISRSVRLRSSASAYLQRTPASATSQTTWTWSGWVKRGTLGTSQTFLCAGTSGTQNYTILQFGSDAIQFDAITAGPVVVGRKYTTAVYRDPSAWYHIVAVWDTTNATAASRMRLYVNGQQVTSFSLSTDPSLNATEFVNSTNVHQIGQFNSAGVNYYDGYLTEINFIDGQALTPSSFGENNAVTGVWQPKKYTGTYGTNGFYLNFSDNSSNTATTIGKDYSGNGNNWTPNNISVTAGVTYDSMLDVPTLWADGGNGRGNYCVINPLDKGSSGTILDGNLATSSQTATANGTFGLTTGKWYFEASFSSITGASSLVEVGIQATNIQGYLSSGNKDLDTAQTAYGATYTTSDIIGCAFDLDAKQMTFYKNGTSQGTFTYTVADTYFPMFRARGTTTFAGTINFGQRPFTYTPPTGFVALNTQNLPTPTISNGANYMAASLWTGNGSTQSIVNSGNNAGSISFQPDFVWIKNRSNAADHALQDIVRGITNVLRSSSTVAEFSGGSSYVTTIDTSGFTLGSSQSVNASTQTYVGWQWKAGGTSSSNTNGSITSTVSVGATQGFSVVTWTGNGISTATVGHGLGVQPAMVIAKARGGVNDWWVGHKGIPNAWIQLNTTIASGTGGGTNGTLNYQSTYTSSVFGFINGSSSVNNANQNAITYVAYCFSEVAGFSKFGSYTGNGSADGVFVYCGFRPRYLMLKRTDAAGYDWFVLDSARNTYNAVNNYLYPDLSNAEGSAFTVCDFLSNGFKFRDNRADWNGSGATYIYMAFAEVPFRYANAR